MYNRNKLIIILLSLLIFRIPVAHLIGDNGCGYLSGPFEVFWCLTTLFGAGLYATMSGMMRDRIRRNQYTNASKVFDLGKKYTLIVSILILILSVLLCQIISVRLLLDPGSRIAFLFVGVAVFLGLFVYLNLGYLNGTDNRRAARMGEVFYGLSMGTGMLIGALFGERYGLKISALLRNEEVSGMYGALGAILGISAGELISLILLASMTIIYQRSFRHIMRSEENRRLEGMGDIAGRFFGGIISDGLQELILYIPVLISIIIFRRHGVASGISDTGDAVGAFFSKYIVITGSLICVSVFPVQGALKGIAVANSEADDQLCADRISSVLARIIYFTLPAVIFTTMLSQILVQTLYKGRTTTAIALLNMGSSVVFLYAVCFLCISVLIRLGYGREMLIISAVSLIIGTVVSFYLVTKKDRGFSGCVIGVMTDLALCIIVSGIILLRNYHMRFRIIQHFVFPLVISGVIGLVIRLVSPGLSNACGNILALAICLIPSWLIYNIACMFLKVVSAGAMSRKFLGSMFVKIGRDLGAY